MILLVGADVLSASHRILLCMHYACIPQSNKARSQASNAAKATTTDQTDQKEEPQNQEEKQKGLGANPGHKQSQNSHTETQNSISQV